MPEEYCIGRIFTGEYPPEAAEWCNNGGIAHIDEIGPQDGERRFQIVPNPVPTEQEIKSQRIAGLEAYLNSTDWYAVRYAETGVEIPEEARQQRQSARDEISSLREELAQNGG